MPKQNTREVVTFRVAPVVARQLDRLAAAEGVPVSALVEQAVIAAILAREADALACGPVITDVAGAWAELGDDDDWTNLLTDAG